MLTSGAATMPRRCVTCPSHASGTPLASWLSLIHHLWMQETTGGEVVEHEMLDTEQTLSLLEVLAVLAVLTSPSDYETPLSYRCPTSPSTNSSRRSTRAKGASGKRRHGSPLHPARLLLCGVVAHPCMVPDQVYPEFLSKSLRELHEMGGRSLTQPYKALSLHPHRTFLS